MKLSIIIVNYNVKHFLKQCLHSVLKASESVSHEIICIDNHSVDGSIEMLINDFPKIKLIRNDKNRGFARACNQGIKIAKGEYILILNPDTVLENDSLIKPIQFMDIHPEAGSLGVKMVDGSGKYLPESKRGLPTPAAAFYKMSGLAKLFYPSQLFGKYYLDYLNKDEIHSVHVLTGAYMLIRKTVLDKVGPFDEQFFMYGEDIDLSHRIIKAGFKNFYFPKTRIIHYKGESTKKQGIKYVYTFYKAMIIFSKKHFSKKNNKALSVILNAAIIFRAFLALTSRFINRFLLPLIDFLIIGFGVIMLTKVWETEVIYTEGGAYPLVFYQIVIPIYAFTWMIFIFLFGGYDKPFSPKKMIAGITIGTLFILLGYSLLDESLRFSRSIILLGSLWGLSSLLILRWGYRQIGILQFSKEKPKRLIIIGKPDEAERVTDFIIKNGTQPEFLGYVSTEEHPIVHKNYIGQISSVEELIKFYQISELIFCSRDISYRQIIDKLTDLQQTPITCKIAPEDCFSIIGSNSISSNEDLYLQEIKVITNKTNMRAKRIFDIVISFILICTIPLNIFIVSNFYGLLKNILWVLINRKTWVGFCPQLDEPFKLPFIKNGVLFVSDGIKDFQANQKVINAINMNYAQKYHLLKDLHILYMGFKKLGRQ